MDNSGKIYLTIFFVAWIHYQVHDVFALRLTNMTAPAVQPPHAPMQLHCRFDMGDEELYAVKWYKDDHEFFRFTPASPDEKITTFPLPGVTVDVSHSQCDQEKCDLLLARPSRLSSGNYRCEVSSEAPAFRLASQTQNVIVAVFPKKHPVIAGLKETFLPTETINATCISDFGDPKPALHFFINKQMVPSKFLAEPPSEEIENTPDVTLKNKKLQLVLPLNEDLKNTSSMTLEITCVSSIKGVPSSVAAHLANSQNVTILDRNRSVNNQKLHWPASNSTATILISQNVYIIIIFVLFKYLKTLLQH